MTTPCSCNSPPARSSCTSVKCRANQLYEVDTPNLAVALLEPGEYRLEVSDSGDATVVRVSEGSAQVEGGGQSGIVGMPADGALQRHAGVPDRTLRRTG